MRRRSSTSYSIRTMMIMMGTWWCPVGSRGNRLRRVRRSRGRRRRRRRLRRRTMRMIMTT